MTELAIVPKLTKETFSKSSIFVRNLSPNVTEKILREYFDRCDEILKIAFRTFPDKPDQVFAQIDFRTSKGVTEGTKLSGVEICGVACAVGVIDPVLAKELGAATQWEFSQDAAAAQGYANLSSSGDAPQGIQAEYFRQKKEEVEDQKFRTVHVGGLTGDVSEDAIRTFVKNFGEVKELKVDKDARGQGFALVEFEKRTDAFKCRMQQRCIVDGQEVTFSEAKSMVNDVAFTEANVHFQSPMFDAMNMQQVLAQQQHLSSKLAQVREAASKLFTQKGDEDKAEEKEKDKDANPFALALRSIYGNEDEGMDQQGKRDRSKKRKKDKKRKDRGRSRSRKGSSSSDSRSRSGSKTKQLAIADADPLGLAKEFDSEAAAAALAAAAAESDDEEDEQIVDVEQEPDALDVLADEEEELLHVQGTDFWVLGESSSTDSSSREGSLGREEGEEKDRRVPDGSKSRSRSPPRPPPARALTEEELEAKAERARRKRRVERRKAKLQQVQELDIFETLEVEDQAGADAEAERAKAKDLEERRKRKKRRKQRLAAVNGIVQEEVDEEKKKEPKAEGESAEDLAAREAEEEELAKERASAIQAARLKKLGYTDEEIALKQMGHSDAEVKEALGALAVGTLAAEERAKKEEEEKAKQAASPAPCASPSPMEGGPEEMMSPCPSPSPEPSKDAAEGAERRAKRLAQKQAADERRQRRQTLREAARKQPQEVGDDDNCDDDNVGDDNIVMTVRTPGKENGKVGGKLAARRARAAALTRGGAPALEVL
eukprot:gnl/TRDRNA2_/TRDRNA2_185968_c0_seq1.p1 gnl/TRDRNA2_/TRDRNA2_185968_c0~~gnl/TRDRNA2_/TRDRNA2_185968_c0_seq1.p1  ORF type:complete len:772 (-),score=252.57 gnl/TRDRNA2_/TRDRNA2_185968_c0_seq1:99-2414(-)